MIKIINKEKTYERKCYVLEIEINKKIVEIAIHEDYNINGDYIDIDWDFLEQYNLTDEEIDIIHEWVNSYKYDEVEE